jgi:hypothetical protein
MLTQQEKRIIVNLHLKGCIGSCGAITSKQRYIVLQKLINEGYLTERMKPTAKAIEETRPLQNYKRDWRAID